MLECLPGACIPNIVQLLSVAQWRPCCESRSPCDNLPVSPSVCSTLGFCVSLSWKTVSWRQRVAGGFLTVLRNSKVEPAYLGQLALRGRLPGTQQCRPCFTLVLRRARNCCVTRGSGPTAMPFGLMLHRPALWNIVRLEAAFMDTDSHQPPHYSSKFIDNVS